MEASQPNLSTRARSVVILAVVVAALGYFVDIYDLVLYTILRKPSLASLGVAAADQVDVGARLLNLQLIGMILGGVAWGVLGDRRGRLTVLFGSIILYSLANLLNACIVATWQYGALRFVAGFGLAGELGAGITLVSELLPARRRGLGTTIVATVGLVGAVVAGIVGQRLTAWDPDRGWRAAYAIGGAMGLGLLVLRVGVLESGLFENVKAVDVSRGNVFMLLWPPRRLARFVGVILVGMPIWFAGGVLFVFSPEIGVALGLPEAPTGPATIIWAYSGVVIGDLASGLLSQLLGRRKLVIGAFMVAYAAATWLLLTRTGGTLEGYYARLCLLGATTGFWVLFVTVASEQFGTNLRATATTSAPNFVRGSAVLITQIWLVLKNRPGASLLSVTLELGLVCIAVGFVALLTLRETFHRDLDYLER